jgi:hypothetical protein
MYNKDIEANKQRGNKMKKIIIEIINGFPVIKGQPDDVAVELLITDTHCGESHKFTFDKNDIRDDIQLVNGAIVKVLKNHGF